jgi:ComF family protein
MFKSFLQLVYPRLCGACQFPLLASEDFVCTACRLDLPKPGLFLPTPNWITAKFDGLFDFNHAHAFFLFSEGSRVQHLMHQVKYKGQSDLGEFLGFWCGKELQKSHSFNFYDAMIPIPLFAKKLSERGYNQAACLTTGIQKATGLSCFEQVLIRKFQGKSLVGQNRAQRYESLSDAFVIEHEELISGQHILLVDDTLTTGATFLAAAEKLKAAGAREISFLALAALK